MRKYILFSIILVSALWVLNVHQTKAAATLRVSSNGHYIEKLDGTPFLFLGDLDWVINMKYSDAEIDALLDDRKTNGFTVIAAAPAADWGSADDKDYYDNSPFINDDITQFNAVYWNRWRGIADKCANRGLYLALIYGGPGLGQYPWYADTDSKRYEYGRKIGDAFKDKTNIIFINSEDADGYKGVGVTGWRTIAEGVADGVNGENDYNGSANYSTTFMSFHPDGPQGSPGYFYDYSSSVWFHTDSWLDVNGVQTWAYNSEIYGDVNADYNKTSPVKPVILLEGGFEAFDYSPYTPYGSYITPHDVRVSAFHTYFAGGAGYTYAHGYSFQQGYSVYDYINSVGAQHMKVLKDFMTSREWWKFVPDQGIISSGVDSGVNRKVAVKSTDGDECYVYYPTVSSASIKMNCVTTSSNVDATWFDSRNGSTQSAGSYTTSQTVSLTPPSGWEDAVLMVKQSSVIPYCGDTYCNGTETCSTCSSDCGQCPVLSNNSQFVSQGVPTQMIASSNNTVSIAMKNTGTSVWTDSDMYFLGSQNPYDNTNWGMHRVLLGSSEAINPDQTKTFTFSVTAPTTLGTYNFQWRMVRESVEWFGELTPNISVSVIPQTTPYCGDNSCNNNETCSTCPSDCGACPSTNPVAWWKLDETSGTAAADSSGNDNTGTLMNGAAWASGKVGGALSLDGVDDYVNIGKAIIGNNPAFSVSAWFKTSSASKQQVYYEGGSGTVMLYCTVNENIVGDVECGMLDDSAAWAGKSTPASSFNNGQWHHLAFVQYSRSSRELFVDGLSKGTDTTGVGTLTLSASRIGSRTSPIGGISDFFSGVMDDIRIYNRALSQSEIQTLYNVGSDTTPPAAPSGVAVN